MEVRNLYLERIGRLGGDKMGILVVSVVIIYASIRGLINYVQKDDSWNRDDVSINDLVSRKLERMRSY